MASKSAPKAPYERSQDTGQRPTAPAPLRRVRYTSLYYQSKAALIWRVCLLTLPFDCFILYLNVPLNLLITSRLTLLVLLVTLGFIARERVLNLAAQLRSRLAELRKGLRKYSWVGAAIFFVLAMIELGLKVRTQGIALQGWGPIVVAVIAFIVVATQAIRAIRKQMKEHVAHITKLSTDRIYWVEQVNLQIFILTIVPIVGARLISLLSAVTSQTERALWWQYLPWFLLSALLLFAAQPVREHFVVQCQRCGFWTSRALKGLRFCPKCNMQAFQLIAVEEETIPK